MKEKNGYSESFRKQALEKVYDRGNRSVKAVAEELQVNHWTLKNWMRVKSAGLRANKAVTTKRPQDWSRGDRLQALLESHGMADEALHAFCRERGIFGHHLQQWRREFEAGAAAVNGSVVRELKETNRALALELKRKEKALAEAAALLVLQKKFQVLWAEKDG